MFFKFLKSRTFCFLICVNEEVRRAVSKRRRSKKQRECLKRQPFEIEIAFAFTFTFCLCCFEAKLLNDPFSSLSSFLVIWLPKQSLAFGNLTSGLKIWFWRRITSSVFCHEYSSPISRRFYTLLVITQFLILIILFTKKNNKKQVKIK